MNWKIIFVDGLMNTQWFNSFSLMNEYLEVRWFFSMIIWNWMIFSWFVPFFDLSQSILDAFTFFGRIEHFYEISLMLRIYFWLIFLLI